MTIKDIIAALEAAAPLGLQEDYDNCGLQTGDSGRECTGVLLTVDVTPEVIAEAAARGCNLVVSHHPLLFKGLKHLTGATRTERAVMASLAEGIAVYSLHTALDNAPDGVSWQMARMLGMEQIETLEPQQSLLKLTTYIPTDKVEEVSAALFGAGAGAIGRYDNCSFSTTGHGTFRPLPGSNPFRGKTDHIHYEPETRVEMVVPRWLKGRLEETLLREHPYETPAYDFTRMENGARVYGSGVVGMLPEPMTPKELVKIVKLTFRSPVARCSALPDGLIRRVALCGGSGSFLTRAAIGAGADAFITSDTSYHNFVDLAGSIFLVDIGHFESEQCCKDIFYRIITEKFPNFAVHYSETEQNPIIYL